jgi:hypothetical protein
VPRPRAADDFTAIRARMEELRPVRRPRAADDFEIEITYPVAARAIGEHGTRASSLPFKKLPVCVKSSRL